MGEKKQRTGTGFGFAAGGVDISLIIVGCAFVCISIDLHCNNL